MSSESKNPLSFLIEKPPHYRTIKSERERLAVSHWPRVGNDRTENQKPGKTKNSYKTRTCLRVSSVSRRVCCDHTMLSLVVCPALLKGTNLRMFFELLSNRTVDKMVGFLVFSRNDPSISLLQLLKPPDGAVLSRDWY